MRVLLIFLLFCSSLYFVFGAPKAYNRTITKTINKGSPFTDTFEVVPYFVGPVTVSLSNFDVKLVVCIQENGIPLPHYERYNSPSCWTSLTFDTQPVTTTTGQTTTGQTTTGHTSTGQTTTGQTTTGQTTTGQTTTGHTTAKITTGQITTGTPRRFINKKSSSFTFTRSKTVDNFRSGFHSIGVYYDSSVTTLNAQNVTLSITGNVCEGMAGDNCDLPIEELPTTHAVDTHVTRYYKYDVFSQDAGYTIQSVFLNFTKNETIVIFARYQGLPSGNVKDIMGTNSLTFNEPNIGRWIIAVAVNETGTTTYTAHVNPTICINFTTGNNCEKKIEQFEKKFLLASKLEKKNDFQVYALVNYTYNALWVSISDSSKDNKALIFASYNRVPQFVNGSLSSYDLTGCNTQYCNNVQSLSTNNSHLTDEYEYEDYHGTWYITVLAQRDGTEYNIWYDSVCPDNCGVHGSCGTSSDNYGLCTCNQSYVGPTCASQSNNWVEYIILIVIAALVLISAILGLVAWAYMRRRAQYVEVK